MEHGVVGGAPSAAESGVDRSLGLSRTAREIRHHLVVLNVDIDPQEIGLVLDAVILDRILETIMTVGKRFDFGAHAAF